MFKRVSFALVAAMLTTAPAQAMCCGGGDKSAGPGDGKMQCMKMDMTKSNSTAPVQSKSDDPHAAMNHDAGKDHSKMSGCCCGCCGDKKSG